MKKILLLCLAVLSGVLTVSADTWCLRWSYNDENFGTAHDFSNNQLKINNLPAGTAIQFKVVNSTYNTWYGNSGSMWWGNCTNWVFSSGEGSNCTFTTDVAGTYTFTLSFDTSSNPVITVSYPDLVTRTVYFYNNLSWTKPYAYFLRDSYWNPDTGSGCKDQFKGVEMEQVAEGSNIWKAEFENWSPNCTMEYIAILKDKQDDYDHFNFTEAVYNEHCANNKMLVPDASKHTSKNNTEYYNYDDGNLEGTWFDYPYTRSVTSGNFGTICLPFDASVDGATLFQITSKVVDGSSNLVGLNLTSAGSITAGVPYIFKATSGELSASYEGTTYISTDYSTSSTMKGNLSSATFNVATNDYIIKDNQLRQVVSGGAATIAQYRACILNSGLSALDTSSARGAYFIDFDDESTDIEEIEAIKDVESETFYNLAGQRVAQPTKGLYIVNGKKVLRK